MVRYTTHTALASAFLLTRLPSLNDLSRLRDITSTSLSAPNLPRNPVVFRALHVVVENSEQNFDRKFDAQQMHLDEMYHM